jgi:hypothetical protein
MLLQTMLLPLGADRFHASTETATDVVE